MGWVVSAVGLVLVGLALRDIYSTLYQPKGQGRLTGLVMRSVWRLAGGPRRASSSAGPLALVGVVLTWVLLVVVGWTLVYAPHLPDALSYSPGLDPASRSAWLDALYLSLVTVGTLGYGDLTPEATWLRLAAPLQGLMGFVLLTAAVSWVLQVYPALSRRRVLALRLSLLRRAQRDDPAWGLDSPSSAYLLGDLAAALAQVRVDLTQNPESYYFRESDQEAALPVMLGYARALAHRAGSSERDDVRLGGAVLREAVADLCGLLQEAFDHEGEDDGAVLRHWAESQGHPA